MSQLRKIRLGYFVSHPIQYQAPLLRQIAAQPDIDLTVYFTSDFSVHGYLDQGFGVEVAWDTPLLDGYKYEVLPNRMLKNARHDRQISSGIFRRLRRNRFDAVWIHGYSSFNSLQVMLGCKLLGIPVLLRSDSTLFDRDRSAWKLRVKILFFRALRSSVSGVLACGTANRKYWEHYFGDGCPIFDVPYAVDNKFFQQRAGEAAARRDALRAELGLEPGRPVLLFASKLQPRKRCLDLVDAFHRITAGPDIDRQPYLLIIGDGDDRKEVERRAAGNPSIRLLGFHNQSQLPRFFDLCDLFILPSIHEPWGLVVNEAMNAGRPILVSDEVGCQPDLVQDGKNGFVFSAGNVDSLVAALQRALSAPGELTRMGRESLRIVALYSFDRDLDGLRSALRALLSAHDLSPGPHRPNEAENHPAEFSA